MSLLKPNLSGSAEIADAPPRSTKKSPAQVQGVVRASSLAGRVAPLRKAVIDPFFPDRTVTAFSGDGGVGKSHTMLHMAVCVSLSKPWLGFTVQGGPVIFLTAEEEIDEVHRRLEDICRFECVDIADLIDLHILPLAGRDALLAVPDRERGVMKPTPLCETLETHLSIVQPKLLVLDTLADVFGGNEIDRAQARSFIGLLRGLAIKSDMAVVVLSHPSLAGMANGTGSSGSTGWTNSVRSRVYLERLKATDEEPTDPDVRNLTVKKANYGPIGLKLTLRWVDGVFVQVAQGDVTEASTMAADSTFLSILRQFSEQGRRVSSQPCSSYAPTLFEKHPDANGIRKKGFAIAMERLLQGNRIHLAISGPPSKRRQHLADGPAPSELPV